MGARGWALHVVAYVSSLPVLIDGGSAYVRGWYGAGDMRKLLGPPEGPHHRPVPPPRSDGLGDAAICRWDKMAVLVCACQGVEGSRGASLGGWEGGSAPAAVFRRQILAAS